MACGGAFYLLGEVEFIIAAEHATFFDPHVTYGMTAVFEPILMSHRMPFGELARMTLLGNHERMTAERACEIGLVSQVASAGGLERGGPLGRRGHRLAAAPGRPGHRAGAVGRPRAVPPAGPRRGRPPCSTWAPTPDELDAGQALFASGTRTQYRQALTGVP